MLKSQLYIACVEERYWGSDFWELLTVLAPADASEEAAYHLAMRLQNRAKCDQDEAKALLRPSQSLGFRDS